MFNAISRHKLREIVREDFPCLENFVDSLYAQPGKTCVKLDDGEWEEIPVCEGFSQGCPLSPILAAIVLNFILKKVDAILGARAATRNKQNSDDKLGGLALILAYVDDANFLVPLEDVKPLLDAFKEVAEPLGCDMNTEKTRIFTTTTGESILPALKLADPTTHASLSSAIQTYSRENIDRSSNDSFPCELTKPCEVTTGLRVLGVPLGSDKFCKAFLLKRVKAAAEDAKKVLDGLSNKQTMLRIFKMCTLHKVTHLFATDVACTPTAQLPSTWNLWSSDFCTEFSTMLNSFLQELLSVDSIPAHAHIISTISLGNGGLGLQHPRLAAVASFMLSLKRAISYASDGIFLPLTTKTIKLPASITSLYQHWDQPRHPSQVLQNFNNYLPSITATITLDNPLAGDNITPKHIHQFMHSTSIPWARETLRHHAGEQYIINLVEEAPDDVLHAIHGLIQPHMSLPLVSMSRTNPKDCLSNKEFDCALKAKLRIGIYPKHACPMCFCGTRVDPHGDHYFTCGEFKKTRCSNAMRDTTEYVMKRICPTAQYCLSADNVDHEKQGHVKETSSKRPFDWQMIINHAKSARLKKSSRLSVIGFDVTVIAPTNPTNLYKNANPITNSISLLEEGERGKFVRGGYDSSESSGITLSGDQFMGKLHERGKALIPQAMDRWGAWGPLFDRFLVRDREQPLVPTYPPNVPNAQLMHQRAVSVDVPFGILNTANKCWQESNPNLWYGDSYIDANPKTWALQQLGLGFTKAIVKHILAADSRVQDSSAVSYYKQRRRLDRFKAITLDSVVQPTPIIESIPVSTTATDAPASPHTILADTEDTTSVGCTQTDDVRTLANLGLLH